MNIWIKIPKKKCNYNIDSFFLNINFKTIIEQRLYLFFYILINGGIIVILKIKVLKFRKILV